MGVDDQIRTIENRLTSLDQERTGLLTDLKNLRSQRDSLKAVILLGRLTNKQRLLKFMICFVCPDT